MQRGELAFATITLETDICHGYRDVARIALRKVSRNCKLPPQRCFIAIRAAHVRQHVKQNESMAGCLETNDVCLCGNDAWLFENPMNHEEEKNSIKNSTRPSTEIFHVPA